jgi:phosphatidyl-myo-inositol dimannoside synthase
MKSIGGMQKVSIQMIEALKKRQDVEIETLILRTPWRYIGIKTFFFLFSLLWRLPRAINRFKPDVVFFSSMVTACVLPFLIRKPSVPCATINHGQDVTLPFFIYQWYLPVVFKNLQGVISVSEATREASIERGMKPEIGVALPNGFDAGSTSELPDKQEARRLLEKKFDLELHSSKLLLTVGRQVKRKGHEWFIREVIEKIRSNVVYMIIGDGPEQESIKQARDQSALKQNIVITGKQPENILNAAYSGADLFVMPNIPVEGDMEGFGIVLLEANRAGTPAIASDLEGIKDVIVQGVNGYRVPAGESEQFAEKIDFVLEKELNPLSESAEKFVEKTFSWDSVVDKYLTFLKSLN